MTYKIIHRDFEIDLLDKNVDYTEQNQWFVDGAPINFTLPISMTLTKELDQVFNMISHLNSNIQQTTFDVKIYKMNKFYDAVMSIESIRDLDIEISFKYGFEEYPNFSKALRQLPLEDKDVVSIREDANTVKPLSYPATNYKYPALHIPTDLLDNSLGRFNAFEGVVNLFENAAFVENTFDSVNNIANNRTVLQPFAYLIHVLIIGFQDAGYTLVGDILQDEKLQKVLLGKLSDYYIDFAPNQQEILLTTTDLTPFEDTETGNVSNNTSFDGSLSGFVFSPSLVGLPTLIKNIIEANFPGNFAIVLQGWIHHTIELTEPGRYKLAGNLNIRRSSSFPNRLYIEIGGEEIYSKIITDAPGVNGNNYFESIELDFDIESAQTLSIYTINGYTIDENSQLTETSIVDMTLTKLASLNNGVFEPAVNEADKVKLSETMPNKTFGDLVKAVMAWRNLDIRPDFTTKEVSMNRIDAAITLPVTQDLRKTEVKFPLREPNQKKSFLLKFSDAGDNPDYRELFYSRNGEETERIQKDENTQEINIGLLPLLNSTKNGLTTVNFEEKNDGILPIFYHDDATTQDNAVLDPTSLMIPAVFQDDHKAWLQFRLFSQTFKWTNILPIEEALVLTVYKRSFAYNQNHLIKQLIVRLIDKDFVEAEFETEA